MRRTAHSPPWSRGLTMSTSSHEVQSYATTPSAFRSLISLSPICTRSRSISSVCWPRRGGGVRILGSEYEYFTGVLTSFIGPQVGCSISLTMSRASTVQNPCISPRFLARGFETHYRAHDAKFPGYHSQPHRAYHFHLVLGATLL